MLSERFARLRAKPTADRAAGPAGRRRDLSGAARPTGEELLAGAVRTEGALVDAALEEVRVGLADDPARADAEDLHDLVAVEVGPQGLQLLLLGEHGDAGLFARAAAEAHEEVGYLLSPDRFSTLGPATSLSPGLIAEKLHFVQAEIRADDVLAGPEGDGHPVEDHARSLYVPLDAALRAVDEGMVHDVKTEVGICRLARMLRTA